MLILLFGMDMHRIFAWKSAFLSHNKIWLLAIRWYACLPTRIPLANKRWMSEHLSIHLFTTCSANFLIVVDSVVLFGLCVYFAVDSKRQMPTLCLSLSFCAACSTYAAHMLVIIHGHDWTKTLPNSEALRIRKDPTWSRISDMKSESCARNDSVQILKQQHGIFDHTLFIFHANLKTIAIQQPGCWSWNSKWQLLLRLEVIVFECRLFSPFTFHFF